MIDLKNKLCIFDCDGTLVDTEILRAKSWEIFLKKYNILFAKEEYLRDCYGKSSEECHKYFYNRFAIKLDEKMKEEKSAISEELIKNELEPIAVVSQFLENIKDIRKCIASNSDKERIMLSISKVGLAKYFNEDEIFGKDLVEQGIIKSVKPAPDIYLYTAKQMGYKSEDCVVFEDSILGIQAAKAANMTVIGCITPSYEDKVAMRKKMKDAGADYIVNNMAELLENY
jgi:HAD superfamily hydrolase (TIGR01509 family)